MGLLLAQVNLKARDPGSVGRFWAAALGWAAHDGHGGTSVRPAGSGWPVPDVVCLDVIGVQDPRTVHDHLHLELGTASAPARDALVGRLHDLGATPVHADVPWTVLADPEGNAFCVREPGDDGAVLGPLAALVLDCQDPRASARFWAEALGRPVLEVSDDRAVLRAGTGPDLVLLAAPHLPEARHRAHLDLLPEPPDDKDAEVARLVALGATAADVGQGDVPWTVLADPEGRRFCVLGRA